MGDNRALQVARHNVSIFSGTIMQARLAKLVPRLLHDLVRLVFSLFSNSLMQQQDHTFTSGLYQTMINAPIKVKISTCTVYIVILACKKVKTFKHNPGIVGRNESMI